MLVLKETKMALATRPKPKTYHKKRQAQHHRRGKHYMKAYYPYLPLLAVVGGGVLISKEWHAPARLVSNSAQLNIAATRLGAVTGSTSNVLLYVVMGITIVAFAIFVFTHWYRFQRVVNRGEKFVAEHPWFDIGLAVIATAGVLLTRANY
ncbi:MAG TPA: hypothetical protein VH234_00595 [Candidatus Saccharimonadales bacterium]|jgi:hypothetical protein|nr:hypothetical protein [Candidatus Saccharimonadales bacterium]